MESSRLQSGAAPASRAGAPVRWWLPRFLDDEWEAQFWSAHVRQWSVQHRAASLAFALVLMAVLVEEAVFDVAGPFRATVLAIRIGTVALNVLVGLVAPSLVRCSSDHLYALPMGVQVVLNSVGLIAVTIVAHSRELEVHHIESENDRVQLSAPYAPLSRMSSLHDLLLITFVLVTRIPLVAVVVTLVQHVCLRVVVALVLDLSIASTVGSEVAIVLLLVFFRHGVEHTERREFHHLVALRIADERQTAILDQMLPKAVREALLGSNPTADTAPTHSTGLLPGADLDPAAPPAVTATEHALDPIRARQSALDASPNAAVGRSASEAASGALVPPTSQLLSHRASITASSSPVATLHASREVTTSHSTRSSTGDAIAAVAMTMGRLSGSPRAPATTGVAPPATTLTTTATAVMPAAAALTPSPPGRVRDAMSSEHAGERASAAPSFPLGASLPASFVVRSNTRRSSAPRLASDEAMIAPLESAGGLVSPTVTTTRRPFTLTTRGMGASLSDPAQRYAVNDDARSVGSARSVAVSVSSSRYGPSQVAAAPPELPFEESVDATGSSFLSGALITGPPPPHELPLASGSLADPPSLPASAVAPGGGTAHSSSRSSSLALSASNLDTAAPAVPVSTTPMVVVSGGPRITRLAMPGRRASQESRIDRSHSRSTRSSVPSMPPSSRNSSPDEHDSFHDRASVGSAYNAAASGAVGAYGSGAAVGAAIAPLASAAAALGASGSSVRNSRGSVLSTMPSSDVGGSRAPDDESFPSALGPMGKRRSLVDAQAPSFHQSLRAARNAGGGIDALLHDIHQRSRDLHEAPAWWISSTDSKSAVAGGATPPVPSTSAAAAASGAVSAAAAASAVVSAQGPRSGRGEVTRGRAPLGGSAGLGAGLGSDTTEGMGSYDVLPVDPEPGPPAPTPGARGRRRGSQLSTDGIGFLYDEVTCVFVQLIGFSDASLMGEANPLEIVKFLTRTHRRFDRIVEHHGVYKVMAISDIYFCATGVPNLDPDGVARAARCAQALRRAHLAAQPKLYGLPIHIRIGIHTGPVAAGIVGFTSINFHLFGATVNVASRMSSTAEPNTIQLSPVVAARLRSLPPWTRRGSSTLGGSEYGLSHTPGGSRTGSTLVPSTAVADAPPPTPTGSGAQGADVRTTRRPRLSDIRAFDVVERGVINVKGVGPMQTFVLRGDGAALPSMMFSSRNSIAEAAWGGGGATPLGSVASSAPGASSAAFAPSFVRSGRATPGSSWASDRNRIAWGERRASADGGPMQATPLSSTPPRVAAPAALLSPTALPLPLRAQPSLDVLPINIVPVQSLGSSTRTSTEGGGAAAVSGEVGVSGRVPTSGSGGRRGSAEVVVARIGSDGAGTRSDPRTRTAPDQSSGHLSSGVPTLPTLVTETTVPKLDSASRSSLPSTEHVRHRPPNLKPLRVGSTSEIGASLVNIRASLPSTPTGSTNWRGSVTSTGAGTGTGTASGAPTTEVTVAVVADGAGPTPNPARGPPPSPSAARTPTLPQGADRPVSSFPRIEVEDIATLEHPLSDLKIEPVSLRFRSRRRELEYQRTRVGRFLLFVRMAFGFMALVFAVLVGSALTVLQGTVQYDTKAWARGGIIVVGLIGLVLTYFRALQRPARLYIIEWLFILLMAAGTLVVNIFLLFSWYEFVDLNITGLFVLSCADLTWNYSRRIVFSVMTVVVACIAASPFVTHHVDHIVTGLTVYIAVAIATVVVVRSRDLKDRRKFVLKQRARATQRESLELLQSMVPRKSHALALLAGLHVVEILDDVTLLYADVVNYTPLCQSIGPDTLIRLLDMMYSAFDRRLNKYALYKVDTIGDALVAVAGIPGYTPPDLDEAGDELRRTGGTGRARRSHRTADPEANAGGEEEEEEEGGGVALSDSDEEGGDGHGVEEANGRWGPRRGSNASDTPAQGRTTRDLLATKMGFDPSDLQRRRRASRPTRTPGGKELRPEDGGDRGQRGSRSTTRAQPGDEPERKSSKRRRNWVQRSHAEAAVLVAVEMMRDVERIRRALKVDFNIRVGIHTGRVVGGVVGQTRPRYVIWGHETVIANKMESSGSPGRIQLSDSTYLRLPPGEYEIERVGLVDVRPKSLIPPKPARPVPAADSSASGPGASAIVAAPGLIAFSATGGPNAPSSSPSSSSSAAAAAAATTAAAAVVATVAPGGSASAGFASSSRPGGRTTPPLFPLSDREEGGSLVGGGSPLRGATPKGSAAEAAFSPPRYALGSPVPPSFGSLGPMMSAPLDLPQPAYHPAMRAPRSASREPPTALETSAGGGRSSETSAPPTSSTAADTPAASGPLTSPTAGSAVPKLTISRPFVGVAFLTAVRGRPVIRPGSLSAAKEAPAAGAGAVGVAAATKQSHERTLGPRERALGGSGTFDLRHHGPSLSFTTAAVKALPPAPKVRKSILEMLEQTPVTDVGTTSTGSNHGTARRRVGSADLFDLGDLAEHVTEQPTHAALASAASAAHMTATGGHASSGPSVSASGHRLGVSDPFVGRRALAVPSGTMDRQPSLVNEPSLLDADVDLIPMSEQLSPFGGRAGHSSPAPASAASSSAAAAVAAAAATAATAAATATGASFSGTSRSAAASAANLAQSVAPSSSTGARSAAPRTWARSFVAEDALTRRRLSSRPSDDGFGSTPSRLRAHEASKSSSHNPSIRHHQHHHHHRHPNEHPHPSSHPDAHERVGSLGSHTDSQSSSRHHGVPAEGGGRTASVAERRSRLHRVTSASSLTRGSQSKPRTDAETQRTMELALLESVSSSEDLDHAVRAGSETNTVSAGPQAVPEAGEGVGSGAGSTVGSAVAGSGSILGYGGLKSHHSQGKVTQFWIAERGRAAAPTVTTSPTMGALPTTDVFVAPLPALVLGDGGPVLQPLVVETSVGSEDGEEGMKVDQSTGGDGGGGGSAVSGMGSSGVDRGRTGSSGRFPGPPILEDPGPGGVEFRPGGRSPVQEGADDDQSDSGRSSRSGRSGRSSHSSRSGRNGHSGHSGRSSHSGSSGSGSGGSGVRGSGGGSSGGGSSSDPRRIRSTGNLEAHRGQRDRARSNASGSGGFERYGSAAAGLSSSGTGSSRDSRALPRAPVAPILAPPSSPMHPDPRFFTGVPTDAIGVITEETHEFTSSNLSREVTSGDV